MDIVRLQAGDGPRLRDVRLRALRDAPGAFSSNIERELAFDPDQWEQRASDPEAPVFLAIEDDRTLGMAGAVPGGNVDAVTVWGTWVDPAARRRGIGTALMKDLTEWARERGTVSLELSVTDAAPAAAALYERIGFEPTGERRPLSSDPKLTEVFLSKRF